MKIPIIILLLLSHFIVTAQQTKESVHQTLVDKYSKFKGIQIEFANQNLPEKSTIYATYGNKYTIKTPGRTLYCDGVTVWNVDTQKKSVVISSVKQNRNSFSIDEVFFNIIKNYIPNELKVIDAKMKRSVLTLLPKSTEFIIQNVNRLNLEVTNKAISGIVIEMNGQSEYFRIFSIKEKNITAIDCTFTPPKNYSVVDLRK
jgi:outer membrane lipoprotein-sorting protein